MRVGRRLGRTRLAAAGALLAGVGGCSMPGMLDPAGEGARSIASLTWWMTGLLTAVGVVTLALLLYALFRRRPEETLRREEEERRPILWVLIGGIAVPGVILVVLFLFIMDSLGTLAAKADDDMTIEVMGYQWWWRVTYRFDGQPSLSFTTANEIHIPVGRRVRVVLLSHDVVHSLWVPDLQGKTDLIPGTRNETWLQASRPGVFRGQCAEYCGLQHAKMEFVVIAQPPDSFAAWVEQQRRPAGTPTSTLALAGQRLFMGAACALCHTIRGTPALGSVAPDLTHLATRRTLAAGILPNTRGHLGGWITNPQEIKPGSLMPNVPIPAEGVTALIAYLETLR